HVRGQRRRGGGERGQRRLAGGRLLRQRPGVRERRLPHAAVEHEAAGAGGKGPAVPGHEGGRDRAVEPHGDAAGRNRRGDRAGGGGRAAAVERELVRAGADAAAGEDGEDHVVGGRRRAAEADAGGAGAGVVDRGREVEAGGAAGDAGGRIRGAHRQE